MNYLPGWYPGVRSSQAEDLPVTEIEFEASSTSTAATITGPAEIIAGDLLVLFDITGNLSSLSPSAPAGFTTAVTTALSAKQYQVLSYKIADGSEASASITGMDPGFGASAKILLVFRPDAPITTAAHADPDQFTGNGNPAAQTVTASDGTPPLIVFGAYSSSGTINPRTMSPAKDGEVANGTTRYIAWKIYNSSSANVSVDMDDEGDGNTLQSCYIEVA